MRTLLIAAVVSLASTLSAQSVYDYNHGLPTLDSYGGLRTDYQLNQPVLRLRYNGFSNQHEPARRTDVLRYNGFDNTWQYTDRSARLRYNGFNNTWYWDR